MTYIEAYAENYIDGKQRLDTIMSQMETDYHRVMVILYLQGWPPSELAEMFDCSRQAIRYQVRKLMDLAGLGDYVIKATTPGNSINQQEESCIENTPPGFLHLA